MDAWLNNKQCKIANGCFGCWGVKLFLTKTFVRNCSFDKNLSFWGLSQFGLFSFVTIWVVELCHSLSFWKFSSLGWILFQFKKFSFETIEVLEFCYHLVFEFCNNLSFWVFLSQFDFFFKFFHILSNFFFFKFFHTRVFEFCQILSFRVLSHLEFVSFVTFRVFDIFHD